MGRAEALSRGEKSLVFSLQAAKNSPDTFDIGTGDPFSLFAKEEEGGVQKESRH
jgi:hypothetical protein